VSIAIHLWGESLAADRIWAEVAALPLEKAGDRLLTFWQGYFDESERNGVFALGGLIGKANDWASFSSEWSDLLPLAKIGPNGKRRFKAREMASSPEGLANMPAFVRLIEKYAFMSVGAILPLENHKRAINRILVQDTVGNHHGVTGNLVDNPYITTFLSLMKTFHAARVEMKIPFELPNDAGVDFFFDKRSEAKALLSAWDSFETYFKGMGWSYGGMPRFVDDEDFLPLQAADGHAYWLVRPFSSTKEKPLSVDSSYKPLIDLTGLKEDRETNQRGADLLWFLDEEYLVREMLDIVNNNLPSGYSAIDAKQLPFGASL